MRAVNGKPRGDANLPSVVADLRNQIDVLSRRLSRLNKPAPSASGGIVDIARIDSTATFPSFAGLPWPSGEVSPNAFDATYAAPLSMVDGASVDWLTVEDGGITPTEDGFYQAWAYVYLQWDSLAEACGVSATVYLNGNDAPDAGMHTVYETSSAAVLVASLTNGPEWMTTSDTWRLEVDGADATTGDIAVSTILWRITKYGKS